MKELVPETRRAFARSKTQRFFSMHNEAYDEIRNAYNKVLKIYYLYARSLDNVEVQVPIGDKVSRAVFAV